ncbi:hypothetical protein [Hymenobacter volaticus]|uniref:Uncharacterized protein n=1 Tax=Hymenobacter volaticus TaxID=2932254 RepID=A0ABY4GGB3_9BACT|nr:hypothetical protein [Hymenobacter volaticus]UOQ69339.1 hypothetical protein MUN86_26960 [Hymenobacter volaticus]
MLGSKEIGLVVLAPALDLSGGVLGIAVVGKVLFAFAYLHRRYLPHVHYGLTVRPAAIGGPVVGCALPELVFTGEEKPDSAVIPPCFALAS